MAIARTLFYKQIGRGGPGYLDVPTYLGVSFEMGNVWATARRGVVRQHAPRREHVSGDGYVSGPGVHRYGVRERGQQAFYLFLGRTF